jgi:hypothetical protein
MKWDRVRLAAAPRVELRVFQESAAPLLPPKAKPPMTAQANELEHGNSRFWRAALRRT